MMDATSGTKPRETAARAIARVFRRHGFEGATMSILSQETGLARSSLYHHFRGGKEEMAREALVQVEQDLVLRLLPLLRGAGSPQSRLRRFSEELHVYYEEGRRGCLLGAFSLQDCPTSVVEHVRRLFGTWIAALSATYAELGMVDGERLAARAVAAVQGGLVLTLATNDRRHLDDALLLLRGDTFDRQK